MTTVQTIDFDAEYAAITARLEADRLRRTFPPMIRIWDGNWILRGPVAATYAGSFQEIDGETGIGKLDMPVDYYISKWIVDVANRPTRNVHITVDKDGVRWSGRMESYVPTLDADGNQIVRVLFKHDYEELKHIVVWANPFLPAEIQFPHGWFLYANAKWALKLTLLVNIMRVESSIWMLPDDPLDPAEWFNFNQSTWSMVVAPLRIEDDASPLSLIYSRFKVFHNVSKPIGSDAQVTWTFRRWLTGDPPPWEGATLRHGCLVIDLVDKSGWTTGTSFGGNIYTGLEHALVDISDDGMTEGIEIMPDPSFPDEYSQPGWKQTLPLVPAIIYREGAHSGIISSDFTGRPATDVQWTTGGHSMPGVNEAISAAINMAGDLIAAMIGVPPIGGMLDALLKPLYTDVLLAFMSWKDPTRAGDLGFSHYKEGWADGADRAYTLSALVALRAKMWATREQYSHTLRVADGAPWLLGQGTQGHFYVGDRIGSVILGAPKGQIYVDRVSDATLSWDQDNPVHWTLTIGEREQKDPVVKALEQFQELLGAVRDLGVL